MQHLAKTAVVAIEVVVAVLFHTEDYYFLVERVIVIVVNAEIVQMVHIGYAENLAAREEVVKEDHCRAAQVLEKNNQEHYLQA